MYEKKFRAWDKKLKKYHYFEGIFNKAPYTETSGFSHYESIPDYHDLIIEQFTGLKDKNGTEIYEGDIVHQEISINQDFHGTYGHYEIIFNNGGFIISYLSSEKGFKLPRGYTGGFMCDVEDVSMKLMIFGKDAYEMHGLEIIGNIHQSPELLKDNE